MIWNSIFLMTLLDLAIIGVAVAMLVMMRRVKPGGQRSLAVSCLVAGVTLVATFYLADLLMMHLGPLLTTHEATMRLMEFLHLEAAWIVTLLFVALLFCALVNFLRERTRDDHKMSLLSDSLPIAICYVDPEERIVFANDQCAKWRQQPADQIVNQHVRELLSPNAYATVEPYLREALAGKQVGFETTMQLRHSPTPRDLQVRLAPHRNEHGEVIGLYALMTDVTARNELEREVVAAGERERASIGRDLHDNLGQTLTGAALKLQVLSQRLEKSGFEELAILDELKETLQIGIEDTRNLARLLAPAFDRGGLETALKALATDASHLFGIECSVDCDGVRHRLGPETSTHIFRIAQESVTNAVRHGRASHVRIKCLCTSERFRIEVSDDGVGIRPLTSETRGMGINTMRYRARMIGGSLRVEPREGGGTRVLCSCPLSRLDAPATPRRHRPAEIDTAEAPRVEPAAAGS